MIKKVLKFLLLPLLLALGVYALFQLLWGRSYHNEVVVDIERPAALVFSLVTEPQHRPRWISSLEKAVLLTEGGVQVGALSEERMVLKGKRYRLENEVLAWQANQTFKQATRSAGFESVTDFVLTPSSQGTQVKVMRDTRYTIASARLLADVINLSAQQKLERDLAALKALAESY